MLPAVVLLVSLACAAMGSPLAPINLQCEHSSVANPFYIDTPFPRLAWTPRLCLWNH